jgi:hypothetical protein
MNLLVVYVVDGHMYNVPFPGSFCNSPPALFTKKERGSYGFVLPDVVK